MKKIIIASVSSLALLGLAACSDTDTTTTQSVEPEVQETAPVTTPGTDTNVIVVPETDEATPADGTTTQSIAPESDTMGTDGTTGAAPDSTVGTDDVEPADDVPAVQ
ncbi:hypothetical protein [Aquibium microcysteis]|uniref:hypothetical protein n=1 Tax=Aquibium microcysteis TaxID=675281 RepID=UPI00165CF8C8|nr:hypothetical protein [Aquibium microcysteis]